MSGLTNPDMLDHSFYLDDCRKVGVLPGPDPEDLRQEELNNSVFSVFTLSVGFAFLIFIFIFLWFFDFNTYFTLLTGMCVPAFIFFKSGFSRR